jgi:prepilin-type N-terminal cleavage/methylation domain-containing protein
MNDTHPLQATAPQPPQRTAEAGFSLVEMLIVLVVMAILMGVAVPAYFGFTDRAKIAVAQANVRSIVPAIERFYSDNETYIGIDNAATASVPGLGAYDPTTLAKVTVSASPAPTQHNYCVYSSAGGATYFMRGPNADITEDPGPNTTDCNAAT